MRASNKVSPKRDVTLPARRGVSAARAPGQQCYRRRRRQTPASKTILVH